MEGEYSINYQKQDSGCIHLQILYSEVNSIFRFMPKMNLVQAQADQMEKISFSNALQHQKI